MYPRVRSGGGVARPASAALAAVTVLCALVRVACVQPLRSWPSNASYDMNMGSELLVMLSTVTALPEPDVAGGQLNWAILVSADPLGVGLNDVVVDTVSVELRGLYHESAGDLDVRVSHAGRSSFLSSNRGGSRAFGAPFTRPYQEVTQSALRHRDFVSWPVAGRGFDYSFSDLTGVNLALGAAGQQSSSMDGDNTAAWRATDGDIRTSGVATHTERHPWYQLDLGSSRSLGTVVLWVPDPENQNNEVQVVKTQGLVTLAGSFRLVVTNNGFAQETGDIAWNAVPTSLYEDPRTATPGLGRGESMQAKLQRLDNCGLVDVTRSAPDFTGGYEWTITFLTAHTDLPELRVSRNNLTAGPRRRPADQVTSVTVSTKTNGTANTFYNADMRYGTVLVSDTPFGTRDLAGARAIASAEQIFEVEYRQRQVNVPMPTNAAGRYVRVQLRQQSYLSLAEVLVYTESFYSVSVFAGGSPLPAGAYAPELAFGDTFGGHDVRGEWVLTVTDSAKQRVVAEFESEPRRVEHGTGAISDWVLTVLPRDRATGAPLPARTMTFFVDITATVLSLPRYGDLFIAEDFVKGQRVPVALGQELFVGPCLGADCNYAFGLGPVLTTSTLGSAAGPNRIGRERAVIYVPRARFRGKDAFTYRINVGSKSGTRVGTVEINVKNCRAGDCSNDLFFNILPTVDEKARTPWNPTPPQFQPPDRFLQPRKYGARLWNDAYCGGIHGGAGYPCNKFAILP
jgi:hypothetical protein